MTLLMVILLLDEEKDADRELSALAEDLINRQAVGSSMEDDSDVDEDEEEESETEMAKPAPRAGTRGRSRRSRS
jgi:hypothetical protein